MEIQVICEGSSIPPYLQSICGRFVYGTSPTVSSLEADGQRCTKLQVVAAVRRAPFFSEASASTPDRAAVLKG
eukprot:2218898-Amphidinium_carterae.1